MLGGETIRGLVKYFSKNQAVTKSTRSVMKQLASGKVKIDMVDIQKRPFAKVSSGI